jgi:hypothetical protein
MVVGIVFTESLRFYKREWILVLSTPKQSNFSNYIPYLTPYSSFPYDPSWDYWDCLLRPSCHDALMIPTANSSPPSPPSRLRWQRLCLKQQVNKHRGPFSTQFAPIELLTRARRNCGDGPSSTWPCLSLQHCLRHARRPVRPFRIEQRRENPNSVVPKAWAATCDSDTNSCLGMQSWDGSLRRRRCGIT